MDEGKLVALHYCSIGNQPLLELKRRDRNGAMTFEFVSAMNLPDPRTDHNVAFSMLLEEDGTFYRSETYEESGKPDTNATRFSRMAAPSV
ncbi:hypothetical protein [Erythrobacter crassostreae]|uniref:Uncharacterized protein n=1 Tax=Erythrobacter crassostreae TaxID=2828328 RepID=A0A9X1F2B7_9SPHN|nr:hypothetical protein [Erythrobacter crassostrea]MBV7258048.1 hypothetical protein [Erythrobacter crassostrea]